MNSVLTSLALLQQATPATQDTGNTAPHFSLKMILASLPHDPASIITLILAAAAVVWVLWAGHRGKPKEESSQE